MKNKETLEEVAERTYREYPTNPIAKPEWHYNRDINCFKKRKAFIAGAKWQQEQIGKSDFLQKLRATMSDAEARRLIFEQFKNK